jgi:polysaccharide biosynthesis/export protein
MQETNRMPKKIYTTNSLPILAIAAVLLCSCAVQRPFVWVEDFTQKEAGAEAYHISPGDRLMVTVWGQTDISGEQMVRADGSISVVLVGDIGVAGKTTEDAAKEIAKALEGDIVQNVHVDVSVLQAVGKYITVVGEVATEGKMELFPNDNLVDIIARSGGFSEFANTDQIYVLRMDKQMNLIRFDFDRLTTCPNAGIHFRLHDGDIVIVD